MTKKVPVNVHCSVVCQVTAFPSVPCTEENLRRVTAIGYSEAAHTAALLIERDPGGTEVGDYEVIKIADELDIRNMTPKGVEVIRMILQAFLGCEFVRVPAGDAPMWVYRRKDFQDKIAAFEAASRFEETIGDKI